MGKERSGGERPGKLNLTVLRTRLQQPPLTGQEVESHIFCLKLTANLKINLGGNCWVFKTGSHFYSPGLLQTLDPQLLKDSCATMPDLKPSPSLCSPRSRSQNSDSSPSNWCRRLIQPWENEYVKQGMGQARAHRLLALVLGRYNCWLEQLVHAGTESWDWGSVPPKSDGYWIVGQDKASLCLLN